MSSVTSRAAGSRACSFSLSSWGFPRLTRFAGGAASRPGHVRKPTAKVLESVTRAGSRHFPQLLTPAAYCSHCQLAINIHPIWDETRKLRTGAIMVLPAEVTNLAITTGRRIACRLVGEETSPSLDLGRRRIQHCTCRARATRLNCHSGHNDGVGDRLWLLSAHWLTLPPAHGCHRLAGTASHASATRCGDNAHAQSADATSSP